MRVRLRDSALSTQLCTTRVRVFVCMMLFLSSCATPAPQARVQEALRAARNVLVDNGSTISILALAATASARANYNILCFQYTAAFQRRLPVKNCKHADAAALAQLGPCNVSILRRACVARAGSAHSSHASPTW